MNPALELARCHAYIGRHISHRKDKGALTVFRLWLLLVNEFGAGLPLPAVEVTEELIRLSWSRKDRYFEIMVLPDGLTEWFLSISGQPPQGTPEDPEPMLEKERVFEILRTVFIDGVKETA